MCLGHPCRRGKYYIRFNNITRLYYGCRLACTDRSASATIIGRAIRVYYPWLCTCTCVYVRNVRVEENEYVAVGGEERDRRSEEGGRTKAAVNPRYAATFTPPRIPHGTTRNTTQLRRLRLREEKNVYLHTLRIITNSHSFDAPFGAYIILVRSTSSTSSSLLWRTTRFSSTRFTSSARLSASE